MKKLLTLTAAAVLATAVGFAGTAWAVTLFVNDATTEAAPCNTVGTFKPDAATPPPSGVYANINEAIGDSAPNGTIKVCPGIYDENVDVTVPGLVLIGLKADPPLLSCLTVTPTQPCVFAVGGAGSAIKITGAGAGVTLTGFKAINSGGDPHAGILVMSNNNMVLKNTAFDNGGDGIRIEGGFGNTVDGNNVHDNVGDGIRVRRVTMGAGINTITDNKAHQNDGNGFQFEFVPAFGDTIVNENRARDNLGCGFVGDADYGTGTDRNRASKNTGGNFCAGFPSGATGSIKGRVTDDVTEDTLEFVAVTAGTDGFTDTTSGNGRYRIRNIPAGDLFLTATVGGCTNFGPVVVTILADDTITVDIELDCS